jgi:hypothetical protein
MAATPWSSSQRRTHLPQRMHFSGSRTMIGDVSSRGMVSRSNGNRSLVTPYSYRRSCSRQSPWRSQAGHSSRWFSTSSCSCFRRDSMTSGERVSMTMSGSAGVAQAATRPPRPSRRATTHSRHPP